MKRTKWFLQVATLAVAIGGLVQAQVNRAWVSGSGTDADPCTRSQPCLTFSGALSKTAAGGEIDAMDAGGFDGLTINKAITIDGGGTIASVVTGSGNAIVVQAGPSDVVTLRNLRINGVGAGINGIRFLSGKELHIKNCVIFGFTNNGIDINLTAPAQITVENSIVRDNAAVGLRVADTAANVSVNVTQSSFATNGYGLWADNNSRVTVTNSDASGNSAIGFVAQATTTGTAILNLENSNAANNGTGVESGGGSGLSTVNLNNASFFDNPSNGIFEGNNGAIRTWLNNINTGSPSAINVLTNHYDIARTGQNIQETLLTPANVASGQFIKLFTQAVDGNIYAQPLYMSNLAIAGGTHNVVFVATDAGSVYAFDADSNAQVNGQNWLWRNKLATPGSLGGGIKSTPVIDATTNTMYVEAKSFESGSYIHRLHSLDIRTGIEKSPGPVVISGSVSGTGDGGTRVTFNPANQMSRPALLLLNGFIYVAFGSNGGDFTNGQYYGWIFVYDEATLSQKGIINTTPNGPTISSGGAGAAVWMSGNGPAGDANGNVFMITGNGTFDDMLNLNGFPGLGDFGDSIIKVGLSNGTPFISDYFSPWNTDNLNSTDEDLGSGGALLLPDQPGSHRHLLVQAGKGGSAGQGPAPFAAIHLVDRDSMGHFCSTCVNDPNIVQEIPGAVGGVWAAPAYWNNNVYFWGSADTLKAFSLNNGLLNATPIGQSTITYTNAANLTISANGATNGIVWTVQTDSSPAVLNAFAATPDGNGHLIQLYSSANRSGDNAGNNPHFIVPTVARGKVYLGTNQLNVYGIETTGTTQ